MSLPLVTIIGRPNVGKSTFFNRLVGFRKAIVNKMSGITRDRNYGISYWNGISFFVIDTGGYTNTNNIHNYKIELEINNQIFLSLEEAHIIIFVVNIYDGVHYIDKEISNIIRKFNKPILLMINKVDNINLINNALDFFQLGYKEYYCVSSINGYGTGEILDKISNILLDHKIKKNKIFNNNIPKFAIVGQPNAGKSTIINNLLGNKRNIVTDIAGTTRDSIESYYQKFGFNCLLIDTSGIRKKMKINKNIEYYSILRSITSIKESDVCFLIIDGVKGLNTQDMKIIQLINKYNKGIIIIINKCDMLNQDNMNNYKNIIKNNLSAFYNIPILFISNKNNNGLINLLKTGIKIYNNRKQKIKTSLLNNIILPIIEKNPPPSKKGKFIKIKYCNQISKDSPYFIFFTNYPNYISKSYKRFIEKNIRNHFDFEGVAIKIEFRIS